MAYTATTFSFGEQPSAAKWNQLGSNDASFHDGTGFAWIVQTQANAGTASGTMYYINLGGIKLLWGVSSSQQFATGSSPTFTLPTGFFSTIQSATNSLNQINTTANQSVGFLGVNTTTITCSTYTVSPLVSGETIYIFIVGT